MAAAEVFLCLEGEGEWEGRVVGLELREWCCCVGEGVRGGGEGLPLYRDEGEVRMS